MAFNHEISAFLQEELRRRGRAEVTAVEAATWLDQAGILGDSASRPAKPLRDLLRGGGIFGAEQRPPVASGRWFIIRAHGTRTMPVSGTPAEPERLESTDTGIDSRIPEDLDEEVRRVVASLDHAAQSVVIDELADKPGLYTLAARSHEGLTALGIEDQPAQTGLAARILYLGKAEDSVRARLQQAHFATGRTGHSTVRRTFAALLDFPVTPRPSRVANPSRRQLMTMTANYALPPAEDEQLSTWMGANLVVRAVASSWAPLARLERAAGAMLKPPLDQEAVPFWAPNPWRADVAAARERKRMEARQRIGLA